MLGIRAAPKELAGVSVVEAVFGAPLTLSGQLVRPPEPVGQPVITGTTPMRQQQEAPPVLAFVLVRRPGKATVDPIFDGPFEVLEARDKTVKVNFGSYADWVAKDRVKCCSGQDEPVVQVKKEERQTVEEMIVSPGSPLGGGSVTAINPRNVCLKIRELVINISSTLL
jgi:hypothetical protein